MLKTALIIAALVTVGCGDNPIAPGQRAQLTVTVSKAAVITIEVPGAQPVGNINVTALSVTVPTRVAVDIDVSAMDGNGHVHEQVTLTQDQTVNVVF